MFCRNDLSVLVLRILELDLPLFAWKRCSKMNEGFSYSHCYITLFVSVENLRIQVTLLAFN